MTLDFTYLQEQGSTGNKDSETSKVPFLVGMRLGESASCASRGARILDGRKHVLFVYLDTDPEEAGTTSKKLGFPAGAGDAFEPSDSLP